MRIDQISTIALALYLALNPISDLLFFHSRFPMYAEIAGCTIGMELVVMAEERPADPFRFTDFHGIAPEDLQPLYTQHNSMQYLTHDLQMYLRDHPAHEPGPVPFRIGYRRLEVLRGEVTRGPFVEVASGTARRE